MAIVKGVNERVHLPLYDSLFVRRGRQLRDHVSSNVLKFFVNIHGKTKIETNMQTSSLLPHWNTFEARALRVVISDLPEHCLGNVDQSATRETASRLNDFDVLFENFDSGLTGEQLTSVRETWNALTYTANAISEDYAECLGSLNRLCKTGHLVNILRTQVELAAIRDEAITVLAETKPAIAKKAALKKLRTILELRDEDNEANALLEVLQEASECLSSLVKLNDLAVRLKDENLRNVEACIKAAERRATQTSLQNDHARLKEWLRELTTERIGLKAQLDQNACRRILGKLIYNSVTTLFVGEKVMIQMPTWFFPAGAGPFAENGNVVTNGFPNPLATFRFAEPVTIDAQQHFRIEIEFPDSAVVDELQGLYGPFFIWVVLDGYLTRDVQ
ncbi:MAG TPA: hypothetical protein VF088_02810 [Pyrinomonadaceae bacterium]